MSTTKKSDTGLTLTEMAYYGRITIKYGSVLLILFMVGRMTFTAFWNYWRAVNPPPPPPPSLGFGLLPPIDFPENEPEDTPTSYKLETASGRFPQISDRAKVFLKFRSVPGLLNDQAAKEIASKLGYVFPPEILSSKIYRFNKVQPIDSNLEIDIISQDFTIKSSFTNRPDLLANNELPDQLQAISTLKNSLSSTGLLENDLATASAQVQYLRIAGQGLERAVSLSDADVIEVSLNRTPIDGVVPIVTPEGNKGSIYALMIGSLSGFDNVVGLEYHYQPVDYTQVHTYSIKTPDLAWKLLQSGEGYVANKGEFETAVVRNIYLAYYDSFSEEDYLQPVYVFEGDGGFIGYVHAIEGRFVQSTSTLN